MREDGAYAGPLPRVKAASMKMGPDHTSKTAAYPPRLCRKIAQMIFQYFSVMVSTGRSPPVVGFVGPPATGGSTTVSTTGTSISSSSQRSLASGSSAVAASVAPSSAHSFGSSAVVASLASSFPVAAGSPHVGMDLARARADQAMDEGASIFGPSAPPTPPLTGIPPHSPGEDDIDGVPCTIDELMAVGVNGPAQMGDVGT